MKSFYKQKDVAGELLQKKGLLLEQRALQGFYHADYLTSIDLEISD